MGRCSSPKRRPSRKQRDDAGDADLACDGAPGGQCQSAEKIIKDLSAKSKKFAAMNKSNWKLLQLYWECGEYLAMIGLLLPYLAVLGLLFLLWQYRCLIWAYAWPITNSLGYFAPSCWWKSTDQRIHEAIDKYHADQIGMADYALESTGGSVLCSSNTYYSKAGPLYSLFGIPIWYSASTPREVIKPDVHPGRCWAMDGTSGFVTIQLRMPVVADTVTVEHIPRSVAPTENDQDAALKDFQVTGHEFDLSSPQIMLGNFTYRKNGKPLQQFKLRDGSCAKSRFPGNWCGPNKQTMRIITVRVFSNNGNPNFTCIYRIRVHAASKLGDNC